MLKDLGDLAGLEVSELFPYELCVSFVIGAGSLYLSEDVAVTGPREGAPSFGAVDVVGVDLQMAEESMAQWKSGPVKAGLYTFLGMMDLDANSAAENREPDPGDLVTLPTTNKIEIKAGEETPVTVIFDLVYN